MKRIAVIHQLPLEYYPPATNLLDCLSRHEDFVVEAYSTVNPKGRRNWENPKVPVTRYPLPFPRQPSLIRLWRYARFLLGTTWRLAVSRPQAVLYIEPHSALPVYLYRRFFNRNAAVLHHCHEYHAPEEFEEPGMRLARLAHRFEKSFLYRHTQWISQTNADRIRLFREDHDGLEDSQFHVLPNHPPVSWRGSVDRAWRQPPPPLRCVCVGSVSLEDTYIREVCEWVERRKDEVSLDIFAYNVTPATATWLRERSQPGSGIRFHDEGLAYDDLPQVLPDYHVGLILYRGNTENYVWNAPNKLFEYLACGLDVWYPPVMQGMEPHQRTDACPKVARVDFEHLDSIDLAALTARENLDPSPDVRYCEDVLEELEEMLTKA